MDITLLHEATSLFPVAHCSSNSANSNQIQRIFNENRYVPIESSVQIIPETEESFDEADSPRIIEIIQNVQKDTDSLQQFNESIDSSDTDKLNNAVKVYIPGGLEEIDLTKEDHIIKILWMQNLLLDTNHFNSFMQILRTKYPTEQKDIRKYNYLLVTFALESPFIDFEKNKITINSNALEFIKRGHRRTTSQKETTQEILSPFIKNKIQRFINNCQTDQAEQLFSLALRSNWIKKEDNETFSIFIKLLMYNPDLNTDSFSSYLRLNQPFPDIYLNIICENLEQAINNFTLISNVTKQNPPNLNALLKFCNKLHQLDLWNTIKEKIQITDEFNETLYIHGFEILESTVNNEIKDRLHSLTKSLLTEYNNEDEAFLSILLSNLNFDDGFLNTALQTIAETLYHAINTLGNDPSKLNSLLRFCSKLHQLNYWDNIKEKIYGIDQHIGNLLIFDWNDHKSFIQKTIKNKIGQITESLLDEYTDENEASLLILLSNLDFENGFLDKALQTIAEALSHAINTLENDPSKLNSLLRFCSKLHQLGYLNKVKDHIIALAQREKNSFEESDNVDYIFAWDDLENIIKTVIKDRVNQLTETLLTEYNNEDEASLSILLSNLNFKDDFKDDFLDTALQTITEALCSDLNHLELNSLLNFFNKLKQFDYWNTIKVNMGIQYESFKRQIAGKFFDKMSSEIEKNQENPYIELNNPPANFRSAFYELFNKLYQYSQKFNALISNLEDNFTPQSNNLMFSYLKNYRDHINNFFNRAIQLLDLPVAFADLYEANTDIGNLDPDQLQEALQGYTLNTNVLLELFSSDQFKEFAVTTSLFAPNTESFQTYLTDIGYINSENPDTIYALPAQISMRIPLLFNELFKGFDFYNESPLKRTIQLSGNFPNELDDQAPFITNF